MIVFTRNGQTTVVTGWRAWLVQSVVFIAALLILAVLVFFLLGVAVTAGAIALIAIPALLIVGLVTSVFGKRV